MSTGSASPMEAHVESDMEIQKAVAQLDFTDDEIYPTLPSSQASTPISQLNVSNRYTPLLAVSEPSSSSQQPFSSQFKIKPIRLPNQFRMIDLVFRISPTSHHF
ncbi:hypothetical protein J6590_090576 [Homalodisca vitripennis]|nr:hypothetical protein J6590_090576 [Homalodisca vitripennis]